MKRLWFTRPPSPCHHATWQLMQSNLYKVSSLAFYQLSYEEAMVHSPTISIPSCHLATHAIKPLQGDKRSRASYRPPGPSRFQKLRRPALKTECHSRCDQDGTIHLPRQGSILYAPISFPRRAVIVKRPHYEPAYTACVICLVS